MAIISRISRLFAADVHAVLERLEEPELVLRQSIREMEEALAAQRAQLQRISSREHRLSRSSAQLKARCEDLNEQLDASIAAQRMDTSKALVKRKLETQALLNNVSEKIDQMHQEAEQLEQDIELRAAQLDALREKAQLLFEQDEQGLETFSQDAPQTWLNEQDVEAALLREIERRSAS